MDTSRILRCCVRNTCLRFCVYLIVTLCACVTVCLDVVHTRFLARRSMEKTPNYKQEHRNDIRYHEDLMEFTDPLNNRTLKVRLTLTPEEQRLIVAQNWSLGDLDMPLPKRKSWSRDTMSRIRRRHLDLLGMQNLTFNRRYKNPCWRDIHQTMYCLPYFYMIGAPKCGTTDLYQRLIKHPDVMQASYKEPHWLTRKRIGAIQAEGLHKDPSTFTAYLAYFLKLALKMYDDSNAQKIIGDASASTMWDNDIWTSLPRNDNPLEPVYTNADYVHKLNKNARILLLLREPVQRLYSDYLYFDEDGDKKSPALFHSHVVKAVRLYTACMAMFSVRSCVYNRDLNAPLKVRLRIGMYYIYLIEWYKKFPAGRILVLNLDEYAKNIKKSLRKVYKFLDLKPLNESVMDDITTRKRANSRSDSDINVGAMWPETRAILNEFYKPFNVRLYDLVNGEGRNKRFPT